MSIKTRAKMLEDLILLKEGSDRIEISDKDKKKLLYKVEIYCLK